MSMFSSRQVIFGAILTSMLLFHQTSVSQPISSAVGSRPFVIVGETESNTTELTTLQQNLTGIEQRARTDRNQALIFMESLEFMGDDLADLSLSSSEKITLPKVKNLSLKEIREEYDQRNLKVVELKKSFEDIVAPFSSKINESKNHVAALPVSRQLEALQDSFNRGEFERVIQTSTQVRLQKPLLSQAEEHLISLLEHGSYRALERTEEGLLHCEKSAVGRTGFYSISDKKTLNESRVLECFSFFLKAAQNLKNIAERNRFFERFNAFQAAMPVQSLSRERLRIETMSAIILYQMAWPEKALQSLQQTLHSADPTDPFHHRATFILSLFLVRAGRMDEAISKLGFLAQDEGLKKKNTDIKPDGITSSLARVTLARIHSSRGQVGASAHWYADSLGFMEKDVSSFLKADIRSESQHVISRFANSALGQAGLLEPQVNILGRIEADLQVLRQMRTGLHQKTLVEVVADLTTLERLFEVYEIKSPRLEGMSKDYLKLKQTSDALSDFGNTLSHLQKRVKETSGHNFDEFQNRTLAFLQKELDSTHLLFRKIDEVSLEVWNRKSLAFQSASRHREHLFERLGNLQDELWPLIRSVEGQRNEKGLSDESLRIQLKTLREVRDIHKRMQRDSFGKIDEKFFVELDAAWKSFSSYLESLEEVMGHVSKRKDEIIVRTGARVNDVESTYGKSLHDFNEVKQRALSHFVDEVGILSFEAERSVNLAREESLLRIGKTESVRLRELKNRESDLRKAKEERIKWLQSVRESIDLSLER